MISSNIQVAQNLHEFYLGMGMLRYCDSGIKKRAVTISSPFSGTVPLSLAQNQLI